MSDIVKSMEQFIKETRYPNLIKFSNEQPQAVKDYIQHFDTEDDAKKNLQYKMRVAFDNVKGKKKRGPGVNINLGILFAKAKAENTIVAEGWNTLGTSVAAASRQFRGNYAGEPGEPGEPTDLADDYILQNGFNLSARFREFCDESTKGSKESGFYIDGNLHEILSLSHVLLLKKNEHHERTIECFGLDNLNALHKDLLEKYIDSSALIETTTFSSIISVIRGFKNSSNRRQVKEQINEIAKFATNEDYRIIDILINCLNKLPNDERLEDIREAELIGSFLDPVLIPIFHDPERNRLFRWLNTTVDDTDLLRPDGNVFI